MAQEEILRRIVIEPKIMLGKPVIKGTRLTVQYVLGRLGQGDTAEALVAEYPGLTRQDIQACLVFAAQALESSSFVPLTDAAA